MCGELIIGIFILITSALVAYLLDKVQLTKRVITYEMLDKDEQFENKEK